MGENPRSVLPGEQGRALRRLEDFVRELKRTGSDGIDGLTAALTSLTATVSALAATVAGLVTGVSSVFGRSGAVTAQAADYANVLKLDDCATPDDNTDLNVSTARHGLMAKLSGDGTKVFTGAGTYITPSDTISGFPRSVSSATAIADGYSTVVSGPLEISGGISITLGSGSSFEILGPSEIEGAVWMPDRPRAMPTPWDDEFNGNSLSASWTKWDVPGYQTGLGVDGRGNMFIRQRNASSGTNNWTGAYRVPPLVGGEYTVTVKVRLSGPPASSTTLRGGLALAEDVVGSPSTSDLYLIEATSGTSGGVFAQTWLDYSGSTVTTHASITLIQTVYYLRMRVFGRAVACDFSNDGFSWQQLDSRTIGFTPKQIVLLGYNQTGVTVIDARLLYDFCRIDAFPGCSAFDATFIGGFV